VNATGENCGRSALSIQTGVVCKVRGKTGGPRPLLSEIIRLAAITLLNSRRPLIHEGRLTPRRNRPSMPTHRQAVVGTLEHVANKLTDFVELTGCERSSPSPTHTSGQTLYSHSPLAEVASQSRHARNRSPVLRLAAHNNTHQLLNRGNLRNNAEFGCETA
jgi:hypothetical protein